MSIGGKEAVLDPDLDTLINVTALGRPAPSARFMGGREHDVATGGDYPEPTPHDLDHILSNQIMLLPAVVPETGPFKGQVSRWIGDEPDVGTGERGAAVALYLALVTAECLANIGHEGNVIVEGPFAGNQIYLDMLSVATNSDVHRSLGSTGTSAGAALLVNGINVPPPVDKSPMSVSDETRDALQSYAVHWRRSVGVERP